MKKILSTMLVLAMLAMPMLALADALELPSFGVTVEAPAGWTVTEQEDEASGMTMAMLTDPNAPTVGVIIVSMENDMFAMFDMNTTDEATLESMMSSFTQSSDGVAMNFSVEEDEAGNKYMLITDEEGKMRMEATFEGKQLLMLSIAAETEALTDADMEIFKAVQEAFAKAK